MIPLLLLGLLELGLRVAGYGNSAAFFVPIEGRPGWVTTNRRFGWRFFPRQVAREPVVVEMERDKPEGTLRVFVLGGSAALGTPDDGFGLARVLQVLLEEAYPEREVEVINVAMAAVSSHVVREIARDCARHEPDLFVVYMGNNEVVGPYGPGSVFGRFTPGSTTTRLAIWTRGTRLGQLLQAPSRWLGSEQEVKEWRGLEMFAGREVAADDPRLAATYEHFRRNLEDIIAAGRESGARVAVSTVAVNLLDSPPFGAADGSEALAEYRLGRQLSGLSPAPGTSATESARVDPEAARRHLERARDLDTLRFRADSGINREIRRVAEEWGEGGLILVDGEAALGRAAAVAGRPGDDLFWEHVHLRFDGTYQLGRAVIEAVGTDSELTAVESSEVAAAGQVAEALGLTAWDRYRMAETIARMTSRPPFTGQLGHQARQARLRRELASHRSAWRREVRVVEEAKRRALGRRPGDLVLGRELARWLHDRGRYDEAAAQWQALVDRVPGVASWHTGLGFALADSGDLERAEVELRRAFDLSGGAAQARINLGEVLERRGEAEAAEREYRAAAEENPRFEPARLALARWLEATGDGAAAEEQLALALTVDPDSATAHRRLAEMLDRQGRLDQAAQSYQSSLTAQPHQPTVRNNLGYVFERQGRLDRAIEQYEAAIDLEPGYALARFNLGDALLSAGMAAEAADAYRFGLALDPSNVQARRNLELALGQLGE